MFLYYFCNFRSHALKVEKNITTPDADIIRELGESGRIELDPPEGILTWVLPSPLPPPRASPLRPSPRPASPPHESLPSKPFPGNPQFPVLGNVLWTLRKDMNKIPPNLCLGFFFLLCYLSYYFLLLPFCCLFSFKIYLFISRVPVYGGLCMYCTRTRTVQ